MATYADSIKNVQDYVRLPLLYDHWYVAGLSEEFDRTPKERTLLERSLVFYRTTDGQLVAARTDACTGPSRSPRAVSKATSWCAATTVFATTPTG